MRRSAALNRRWQRLSCPCPCPTMIPRSLPSDCSLPDPRFVLGTPGAYCKYWPVPAKARSVLCLAVDPRGNGNAGKRKALPIAEGYGVQMLVWCTSRLVTDFLISRRSWTLRLLLTETFEMCYCAGRWEGSNYMPQAFISRRISLSVRHQSIHPRPNG